MEKEEIEQKFERLMYIKKILYGFGIPPKDSQIYKDLEELREQYKRINLTK